MSDVSKDVSKERWRLLLEHRHMLLNYLRCLLRDDSEAEDLFQEVGLVVMSHDTGPSQSDRFPAWCRGIARNLVHRHVRRRSRQVRFPSDEFMNVVGRAYDEADAEEAEWEMRRRALGQCIEALPADDRDLVHGRYVEGQHAHELGRRVGFTAEAIRMRLMRLRKGLERCIEERIAGAWRHPSQVS